MLQQTTNQLNQRSRPTQALALHYDRLLSRNLREGNKEIAIWEGLVEPHTLVELTEFLQGTTELQK
jgi:hypothetical protein